MPDWVQVLGSSNVSAIKYHEPTRECWVRFLDGSVYLYSDVSPERWQELYHSSSKGRFVQIVLRRENNGQRVSDTSPMFPVPQPGPEPTEPEGGEPNAD